MRLKGSDELRFYSMARWFICLMLVLSWSPRSRALGAPGEAGASVIGAAVPFYPPLARSAHVQGTVTLEVTTSGQSFGSIKLMNGHPLLSAAAIENHRTWVLFKATPVNFRVTYRYKISDKCKGNPTVTLNLPTDVSVCSQPSPPNIP